MASQPERRRGNARPRPQAAHSRRETVEPSRRTKQKARPQEGAGGERGRRFEPASRSRTNSEWRANRSDVEVTQGRGRRPRTLDARPSSPADAPSKKPAPRKGPAVSGGGDSSRPHGAGRTPNGEPTGATSR